MKIFKVKTQKLIIKKIKSMRRRELKTMMINNK
jgi:hypothetical protein